MRKFAKLEGYWKNHNQSYTWGTRYVDVNLLETFEYVSMPERDENGVHIELTEQEQIDMDVVGQQTHRFTMGISLAHGEFPGVSPQQFLKIIHAELTVPDDAEESA